MKADTHASGEWAITWDACQLSIYGKRNERIAEVFGENNVDALNNACLIAAAPDLLAALESLAVGLSPASVEMQRENLADLCRVCREIAENAIAKVKEGDA
jgi:hypothetical protein